MTSSSNEKIVIIGATSGIGYELAKLYVAAGCKVGITGRRAHLLEELRLLYPQQIITACFDVMGNDNVHHVDALIAELGGLDLLIYNSGYGEISETLDWSIDKTIVDTNVNGFITIANHTFNYFARQGYGQLAATSSIASIAGNPFAPAYSASKAFMSTYLEGLWIKARKMKRQGLITKEIIITDIQPGFVKTKMAKGKGRFWEAPVDKAARQIYKAIGQHRFRIYITRRWWLVAKLLLWMPGWLRRRIL